MRWTKEAEEMLWTTVFRTQAFHIDLTAISQEWPGKDKPTPKALKEHLAKYRKSLGPDCRVTFGMSAKNDGQGASATPQGTPRKRGPNKKATPKKGTKGKGAVIDDQDENAGEGDVMDEGCVKKEEQDEDEDVDVEMRSPKKVKVEDEDVC